jgi:D-alanyl-D-alanine carboxypeptidase/D-alanyl-D-alanine-endopeptidase (penicillin-binding protein 4)
MTRRRAAILALVALPAWLPVVAEAGPPASSPSPREALAAEVARLAADYAEATGAKVGVHAVALPGGAPLCGLHEDRPLIPASNQKIPTTAVALARLGADFEFRTALAVSGDDLVVLGDGDPTTGDPVLAAEAGRDIYAVFDAWAAAAAKAGIEKVAGNLIIRPGVFRGGVHPDWPENQRQRWYSAPACGVNFNDNCLEVGFQVAGGEVRPVVGPASRYLRIVNEVTLGRRHLWSCRFDESGRRVTLRGTVKRSTPDPWPVAVPDPAELFAAVLADRFARAGIPLAGRIVIDRRPNGKRPPPDTPGILAVERTPLAAAVGRANKRSLNLASECLLLRSASRPGERVGWKQAAELAEAVLTERHGLAEDSFTVADGSGYSRRNRISPAALTSLLTSLREEQILVGSLPVSGVNGSLTGRMKGALRGRVAAKTGTLAGVSGLSGYVLDADGRPAVAFSVLVNGRTWRKGRSARGLSNEICAALVRWVDRRPGSDDEG